MKPMRMTALLLLWVSPWAWSAPANMKEGLWEIKTRTEMPNIPGMPAGMQMPTMTLQHCYTAKDIQDNRAMKPQEGDCKVTRMQQSGDSMEWAMECKGQQAMQMQGKGTFKGDSYSLRSTMKFLNGEMKGQQMSSQIDARRLGACKAR